MSSEFWSAIVGAIVGGTIAALLQTLNLRAAAREREAQQLQTYRANARSLLVKLIKIYSDFVAIHGHFQDCRASAEKKQLEHGWKSIIPLANLPRPLHFTPEELSTLAAVRDDALFNDILSMDEVHAGIVEALGTYRAKRTALSANLPAQMSGTVGAITLTQSQYQEYAPKAVELDQLAGELEQLLAGEVDPTFSVASRAAEKFNSAYAMKLQVSPIVTGDAKTESIGTVPISDG